LLSIRNFSGQLSVIKTTDEDLNVSYTFTDEMGHVVLTRQMKGSETHDTYYVYDDKSNLCFVLQPMYQSSANLDLYAFQYKYDGRNRCIWKKLPGAGYMEMVYDNADRLVFSQDGNQRALTSGNWTYYKYDGLNRLTEQGTCTNKVTTSGTNVLVQHFYDSFRYYDPKTGNYISQDPIGLAGGNPTLYGYVFDPNTQIDPLGLDCSYVSKDFKNGASFLITKKDYLRFIAGKKKVGRVDGQFVIPKKDMDNLLKKSNGDIAQIEKALGIPEGNWQDKGGLVRVDIPNPEDYNLRLPTANMSGANEKFELGGKTSGGIPEGVIDQVPKINVIITKL